MNRTEAGRLLLCCDAAGCLAAAGALAASPRLAAQIDTSAAVRWSLVGALGATSALCAAGGGDPAGVDRRLERAFWANMGWVAVGSASFRSRPTVTGRRLVAVTVLLDNLAAAGQRWVLRRGRS